MKRVAWWLLLFGVALGLRAQTPDAEYLKVYNQIQDGERLEKSGDPGGALEHFQAARRDLQAFAKAHPSWNPKIVGFRLEDLATRVGTLSARLPERPAVAAAPTASGSRLETAVLVSPPAGGALADTLSLELAAARARAEEAESRMSAAESRAQVALGKADMATARVNEVNDRMSRLALDLRQARDRVEVLEAANANLEKSRERLERERGGLEAKLKEALSPRAAAVDPAELAKAEDRILLLVRENEILKAGLDHQMAENRRILDTAKRAVELERQLEGARSELAASRRQAEELRGERQKLASRLESLTRKSGERAATLEGEIEELKRALASARQGARSNLAADATAELSAMRTELVEERRLGDKLRTENETLLREIERLTDIGITPASLKVPEVPLEDSASANRMRRLERERDELRRELEDSRTELRRLERTRGNGAGDDKSRELAREVARLEARVGALESRPVPYSAEELALFEKPSPEPRRDPVAMAQAASPRDPDPASKAESSTPAGPTNAAPAAAVSGAAGPDGVVSTNKASGPKRRTIRDLPPGASGLAAQAQRAFGQRRLGDAEKAYREILKIDENNVFTLGNLAAIVVEQGRTEEGETLLKKALALDSQDPFSLSLLGILRFRQQRYEDAFDALSQAAQLDPEDAATQTYLGITLSERGQRPAAEAALRKALKLNPGSAAAHYNLSVVYATQKPPYLELAKYHYEKARRAGQPANPAFEALLRGETRPGAETPKP